MSRDTLVPRTQQVIRLSNTLLAANIAPETPLNVASTFPQPTKTSTSHPIPASSLQTPRSDPLLHPHPPQRPLPSLHIAPSRPRSPAKSPQERHLRYDGPTLLRRRRGAESRRCRSVYIATPLSSTPRARSREKTPRQRTERIHKPHRGSGF